MIMCGRLSAASVVADTMMMARKRWRDEVKERWGVVGIFMRLGVSVVER